MSSQILVVNGQGRRGTFQVWRITGQWGNWLGHLMFSQAFFVYLVEGVEIVRKNNCNPGLFYGC